MDDSPVNALSIKTRNVGGPPKGSQNALKHGVFAIEAKRKRGKLDKRTSPFRAIRKNERQIVANHTEARKRWHASKAARLQYYAERINDHLLTLKHVIRKGKVNPAVDLLLRLSDAVDGDYEAYDALVHGEKPLDLARRIQLEKLQQSGGK